MRHVLLLPRLPLLLPVIAHGQKGPPPLPPGVKALRDQDYVGGGNKRQMLDLYLPEAPSEKPRPLVVYIHGGGWEQGGSRVTGRGRGK